MASIHTRARKDGSVTFRVAFRIDGRQAQESFDDIDQARKFCGLVGRIGGREAREVLLGMDSEDGDSPTLSKWLDEYLDPASGILGGVSKSTRDDYRSMAARSFLEHLGDIPLSGITQRSIRGWINWQSEQPSARRSGRSVSAKTIKNYHALLSGALAAAVAEGIIESNPAFGLELPSGQREPITFLTEKEFARVYELMPEYYKPTALALAGSGLRFGELSALTWADLVEVDGGWCLDVNKAWKDGANRRRAIGAPKTASGIRLVSISSDIVEALGKRGKPGDFIFKAKRGGALISTTFAKCGLHPAVKAAGLTRRPRVHDLRHSHVSWLIARNVPLPYIQRRIGHTNIDTTVRVYGHLLPEALSATRDAASDAIKLAMAA